MIRKILKGLYVGLLVIGCVIALGGLGYLLISGRLYSLAPGSKLDFFDTRIENVSDEFMRRSPRLKATFEEFKKCKRKPECEKISFRKRDAIIRAEWPAIFDRLLVHDDWGSKMFTAIAHDRFLQDVKDHGGEEKMRKQCVPLIGYYHHDKGPYYYSLKTKERGYRCNPPAPPPP